MQNFQSDQVEREFLSGNNPIDVIEVICNADMAITNVNMHIVREMVTLHSVQNWFDRYNKIEGVHTCC